MAEPSPPPESPSASYSYLDKLLHPNSNESQPSNSFSPKNSSSAHNSPAGPPVAHTTGPCISSDFNGPPSVASSTARSRSDHAYPQFLSRRMKELKIEFPDYNHQKKMDIISDEWKLLRANNNLHSNNNNSNNNSGPPSNSRPRNTGIRCEVCDKTYTSEYHLSQHLISKGHRLKANAAVDTSASVMSNSLMSASTSQISDYADLKSPLSAQPSAFTSPRNTSQHSPKNLPNLPTTTTTCVGNLPTPASKNSFSGTPNLANSMNKLINTTSMNNVNFNLSNNCLNNQVSQTISITSQNSQMYADSGVKNTRSETTQSNHRYAAPSSLSGRCSGKRKSMASNPYQLDHYNNHTNHLHGRNPMNMHQNSPMNFDFSANLNAGPSGHLATHQNFGAYNHHNVNGFGFGFGLSSLNDQPHQVTSGGKTRSDHEETSLSSLAEQVKNVFIAKQNTNDEVKKQINECKNSSSYKQILEHREKIRDLRKLVKAYHGLKMKYRKNDDQPANCNNSLYDLSVSDSNHFRNVAGNAGAQMMTTTVFYSNATQPPPHYPEVAAGQNFNVAGGSGYVLHAMQARQGPGQPNFRVDNANYNPHLNEYSNPEADHMN